MTRRLLAATGIVIAAGAGLTIPAQAQAATLATATRSVAVADRVASQDYFEEEFDTAVAGTPPATGKYCKSIPGAQVCFQPAGDVIWVMDNRKDGHSAVAMWRELPRFAPDYRRWGTCANSLGMGHWGKCNKDLPETSTFRAVPAVWDAGTGYFYGQGDDPLYVAVNRGQ